MSSSQTHATLKRSGYVPPTGPWRDGIEPATLTLHDLEHMLAWAYCDEISDLTLCTDEPPLALIGVEWTRLGVRPLGRAEIDELVMAMYGNHAAAMLSGGEAIDFGYGVTLTRLVRARFRVNVVSAHTQHNEAGASMSLRTIPDVPKSCQDLGLESEIVEAHRYVALSQGLVLTVGATGTGKTTLNAAMLRDALELTPALKIATVEAPIEYVLSMVPARKGFVLQSEVGKHVHSFADGLRNAMRQKPNVILLGEARDAETMGELINASLTGHAVYSTVHAPSVAQAFARVVQMFPFAQQRSATATLVDVMRLCITQRLVPRVGGGRVALREFLVFDQGMRSRLASVRPEDLAPIVHQEVKARGQTLLADARKKRSEQLIDEHTLTVIEAEAAEYEGVDS